MNRLELDELYSQSCLMNWHQILAARACGEAGGGIWAWAFGFTPPSTVKIWGVFFWRLSQGLDSRAFIVRFLNRNQFFVERHLATIRLGASEEKFCDTYH